MPKKLQKSLKEYLFKIKRPPIPQFHIPSNSFSSSKSWVLSGCKHTRTLSFAIEQNQEQTSYNHNDAATLGDVDRFLFENFRSLYVKDVEDNDDKNGQINCEIKNPRGSLIESPHFIDSPSDLTESEDSGSSSTSTTLNGFITNGNDRGKDVMVSNDRIAVLRYSPSPYDDFRRSMEEMVEIRSHNHADVDWDFMEELMFSYLHLNEKKLHKYIISAFVDLIVALRQNEGRIGARSRNVGSDRDRRKGREVK